MQCIDVFKDKYPEYFHDHDWQTDNGQTGILADLFSGVSKVPCTFFRRLQRLKCFNLPLPKLLFAEESKLKTVLGKVGVIAEQSAHWVWSINGRLIQTRHDSNVSLLMLFCLIFPQDCERE
jgi:hypothetical protein